MKVSIVTISFNQARFLEAALKSVINQGYDDLEYIVIDAGSTDGSREIIAEYAKDISRVVFEEDRGAADGLNKGFALATGDIFGFLNSDDILLPGAVKTAVKFLKNRPDIGVASGNAYIIDECDSVIRKAYSDRFSLRAAAYGSASLLQQSTFFRRDAFNRAGGFNLQNRCAWDGELWIDMAEKGVTFGIVDEFMSCYRLHNSSITGSAKLHAAILEHQNRMFERIMGRQRARIDKLLGPVRRLQRHSRNLPDVLQRIRYGRIYGRCTSSYAG